MIEKEVWRDIPGYEGYYQASNLGRVRSLDRTVIYKDGREYFYKGKLIKGRISKGYKYTNVSINNVGRNLLFSQLVAMAFLGHEPNGHELVVDHINGDRSDNRLENLRIVTNRENISTCFRSDRDSFSSEYVGINWDEKASKWKAEIGHKGVRTHLGYYNTEIEASKAYQLALSKIKDGSFDPNYYKPKFTSEYKGVSFHKASNKWVAQITINRKQKHLGRFNNEIDASNAYQKALKLKQDVTAL